MNRHAAISAIPLLQMSAWVGNSNGISAQVGAQFKAGSPAPVNLAPYTDNERAEQILGFKWDAGSKTSIAGSDGVNVLVFAKDGEVVAYAEHPRNQGDFSKLEPRCLVGERSTVVRQPGGDGWVFLVASP